MGGPRLELPVPVPAATGTRKAGNSAAFDVAAAIAATFAAERAGLAATVERAGPARLGLAGRPAAEPVLAAACGTIVATSYITDSHQEPEAEVATAARNLVAAPLTAARAFTKSCHLPNHWPLPSCPSSFHFDSSPVLSQCSPHCSPSPIGSALVVSFEPRRHLRCRVNLFEHITPSFFSSRFIGQQFESCFENVTSSRRFFLDSSSQGRRKSSG